MEVRFFPRDNNHFSSEPAATGQQALRLRMEPKIPSSGSVNGARVGIEIQETSSFRG